MALIEAQADENANPFEFCHKILPCGHKCNGVKGESDCLPCLKPECIQEAIDEYDRFMAQPAL